MRADAGPEPTTIYNLRQNHRSVLPTYCYRNEAELLRRLDDRVIQPAEDLVRQLLRYRIEQDPLGAATKSVAAKQRRRR
jgi:hypothetical protein